jgi:hypothetical protein
MSTAITFRKGTTEKTDAYRYIQKFSSEGLERTKKGEKNEEEKETRDKTPKNNDRL